jgi:hypothetical protein
LDLFKGDELRFGQDEALLFALGFQGFQPLLHGLEID